MRRAFLRFCTRFLDLSDALYIWQPVVPLTKLLGHTRSRTGGGKEINMDFSSEQIKQNMGRPESYFECFWQFTLALVCGESRAAIVSRSPRQMSIREQVLGTCVETP